MKITVLRWRWPTLILLTILHFILKFDVYRVHSALHNVDVVVSILLVWWGRETAGVWRIRWIRRIHWTTASGRVWLIVGEPHHWIMKSCEPLSLVLAGGKQVLFFRENANFWCAVRYINNTRIYFRFFYSRHVRQLCIHTTLQSNSMQSVAILCAKINVIFNSSFSQLWVMSLHVVKESK